MREGFWRILSCLMGVFCSLPLLLASDSAGNLYELYNRAWDALAVGGWGALGCLLLSRLLYRGSWSSLQPGPPRGFSSSHQVADLLRTILGGFALISFLAVPMARNTNSVPFSLLSGFLALVLWYGLQRWEVSTATGVKVYRTFYGLQWLAREAHPAIHWETPTGPVGPRSDQQAFAARHRWAWQLALGTAVVVASLLVICVASKGGEWPAVLAAAFNAPIPCSVAELTFSALAKRAAPSLSFSVAVCCTGLSSARLHVVGGWRWPLIP